ncbi:MAG TPA: Hsp20/alpha crystallin family protein [Isosphaeraceae bacterium]|jgi:HSP20 family protein|nr:Hsp20/alpha crystallin family protein [Isosphaeraceae bacterium]
MPRPRDFAAVPIHALQDELHRLIDRYRGPGPGHAAPGIWSPAVDLYETPEEIGLWVDLPGVDPSAVEVAVTGQTLTLRGERAAEPTATAARGRGRTERPAGPFLREIDLGADVDADAARAEASLGVLHIRLPKLQAERPKTIPIQVS